MAPDTLIERPATRTRRFEPEDVRRRQLIDATIAAIAELGFPATTVGAIAERAGVSNGLVAFYFGDKEGMLEATLRHLASQLQQTHLDLQRRAETPRARIDAVIAANLGAAQFDRRLSTVWLSFWSLVPTRPRFRRVQRVYERRMISNLVSGFRPLVGAEAARDLASATAAVIDGLWLRATLSSDEPDSAAARARVGAFVDAQLAIFDLARLRRPPAP
jgi:transcriptional repressor BetI